MDTKSVKTILSVCMDTFNDFNTLLDITLNEDI